LQERAPHPISEPHPRRVWARRDRRELRAQLHPARAVARRCEVCRLRFCLRACVVSPSLRISGYGGRYFTAARSYLCLADQIERRGGCWCFGCPVRGCGTWLSIERSQRVRDVAAQVGHCLSRLRLVE